jgi:hypothetical protein
MIPAKIWSLASSKTISESGGSKPKNILWIISKKKQNLKTGKKIGGVPGQSLIVRSNPLLVIFH